jgi:DNA-binding transcriptional regulator GbsR (MarR family)
MSPTPSSPAWLAARRKFIQAGGQTTQSFGLGRILGQVFVLLYLSPNPLCLDDITEDLGVSKASVSMTVRQLAGWSAVKRIWVKGDRKDYYEAETDFNAMLRSGLLATLRKKLDTAGSQIDLIGGSIEEMLGNTNGEERQQVEMVAERLRRAKDFHTKVNGLLSNPLLDHLL